MSAFGISIPRRISVKLPTIFVLSHQYRFPAKEKRSHALRISGLRFLHGGIPRRDTVIIQHARTLASPNIMCVESAEGKDEVIFNEMHNTSYRKARGGLSNHLLRA